MAGFQAMDNALSGLLAARRSLDTTAHNIANAGNKSYSRQRAELQTNRPQVIGGLTIGTGVHVAEITRARDHMLDTRMRQSTSNLNRFSQLTTLYDDIETSLNEPSEEGLRGTLGELNAAMQELANEPENRGSRRTVIGQAETFASGIRRFYGTLNDIGGGEGENSINVQIESALDEMNNIAENIASLNREINASEARGTNPNDLLDQRTELTRELSEYIDVTVQETSEQFRVNVAGFTLVQGSESHELDFRQPGPGEPRKIVYDDHLESVVTPQNGKLKALMDMRGEGIPDIIDDLNDLTVRLVDRFNDIHRSGFGMQEQSRNNFWSELPTADEGMFRFEGLGDVGGDYPERKAGHVDAPDELLFIDGESDDAREMPRNFDGDSGISDNPDGTLLINGHSINYNMKEDSLDDIIDRINESPNHAQAYWSADERLVITGAQSNDYRIDEMRDNGLLLDKTNILSVGGFNQQGTRNVADPAEELSELEFFDDVEYENGTLEFNSQRFDDFTINYDAEEDSLEDLVERINEASEQADSDVVASITRENELRLFTAHAEELEEDVEAGNERELHIENVYDVNRGDTVRISDDDDAEEARVIHVNREEGIITVDSLENDYDDGDAVVHINNQQDEFRVNDTSSDIVEDVYDDDPLPIGDWPEDDAGDPQDWTGISIDGEETSNYNQGDTLILANEDGTNVVETTVEKVYDGDEDDEGIIFVDESDFDSDDFDEDEGWTVRSHKNKHETRNLLAGLGMNRMYHDARSNEYAITGQSQRPPLADQAAALEVDSLIDANPDLIAASGGDDIDNTGIADTMKGEGDGSIMNELSNLHGQNIMARGEKSMDDHLSEMAAEIGSDSSLVRREERASEQLVFQLEDQIQSVSGVSLDEEMSKLIREQQGFQAASRVIGAVRDMSNEIMRLI